MELRRIRADEGPRLKAIRLRSYAESPDAFGTTLTEAMQEPDAFWAERAEVTSRSAQMIIIVAVEAGEWYGLVRGVIEPEEHDQAWLTSLWVDPTHRRAGLASALCAEVERWAREQGARTLRLWVTETNAPAKRLYVRLGFVATGTFSPHPSNPSLRELLMWRDLN